MLKISKLRYGYFTAHPESMKRDSLIPNILERQKQNNLSSNNITVKIKKRNVFVMKKIKLPI